ncbi:unnamed protein product [Kuraishia capsulata CBS 1993]|uniref:Uncharacterized protein n=1 Tax=Kuraishia capsulata CBS 1993 TaxID=1382522 RepID=W6MI40_9ASCO|nr:uncharacterized protein KUCA_T00001751001 [Kuraishia capsulata CBS 1993]CDK25781.1 unnamed protein product [Kuraishia capsulata CBS 1993]
MTLIVATLFLPYTVHFEIENTSSDLDEPSDKLSEVALAFPRPSGSRTESFLATSKRTSLSILPSMNSSGFLGGSNSPQRSITPDVSSAATTSQNSNPDAEKGNGVFDSNSDFVNGTTSVEDFFYSNPVARKSNIGLVALNDEKSEIYKPSERNDAKRGPSSLRISSTNPDGTTVYSSTTYIQPKSQATAPVKSSVVDRGMNKDPTLSSMRVSRPSTLLRRSSNVGNLTSRSDQAAQNREQAQKSSSQSYVFDKVAPYGGLSKPDLKEFLIHPENVFETAPWTVTDFDKGNGSLKNAVRTARQTKLVEKATWVGALGMPCDVVPETTKTKIAKQMRLGYNSEAIFLKDSDFDGHYRSFCKQILWPTLHYQIPDDPKSKAFEEDSWVDYKKVNQEFADKIIEVYNEGDTIWVHDYHLLLVPKMVREKLPDAKIGFFLHVSFPSSEVFRCFAQRKSLLEGMLGANTITFQTEEYVRHFFQTCNRILLADFTHDGILYNNTTIKVNTHPIGIDAKSLMKTLASPEVTEWKKLIKQRWRNKRLIVSRDKLDKIRGTKQKLLAYEKFLTENPEYLDNTMMIVVCLKGKSGDDDLETEILRIVERINSKTKNISSDKPVVYLNQDIDFEQYLALLSEAATFIVSSMREGMNLTCHEFIVATNEKHSPLILSEFTGSASVLVNGPLLINPWDIKEVAYRIKQALAMSEEEKLQRWTQSFNVVKNQDSQRWLQDCLTSIEQAWGEQQQRRNFHVKCLTQKAFNERYNRVSSEKRLIILDLGSLTSTVSVQGSIINPVQIQRVLKTLSDLVSDPQNVVYVTSHLKRADLTRKYRTVSNLGLIAENGGYIKPPQSNHWISIVEEHEFQWIPSVVEVMEAVSERLHGSTIEVEDCTVRFHTEKITDVDEEHQMSLVGDLITHINDLFSKENVHASLVDKIVVIQEANLAKRSLEYIISTINKSDEHKFIGSILPQSPSEKIGLLLIVGGSRPVDEQLFIFGDELAEDHKVDDTLTIQIGSITQSVASERLEGFNEFLTVIASTKN